MLLPRIAAVLRAHVGLIAVLAIPVLLVGGWYALTRDPAYRSEVVVSFAPTPMAAPDQSFLRLVRQYQLLATSADVLRAAERRADLTAGTLDQAVFVGSPGDTLQLAVDVTTDDPRTTEDGAAAVATEIVSRAASDSLVRADVLTGPTGADDETPLRQMLAIAAAVLLAPLPGITLAFFLEGVRPRLRTREDVAALGLPVLPCVRPRRPRRWPGGAGGPMSGLTALRAQLDDPDRFAGGPVVLTSPTTAEADLVSALAGGLSAPWPAGAGGPAVDVVPCAGLLTGDGEAVAAVRKHGRVILVFRTGTLREQAEDCARLLDRLGVEVVGGVLAR